MPTPLCALCANTHDVSACAVAPRDETVALCAACRAGVKGAAAASDALEHRDCNGALLATGDTVTLIKDLVVKGGGFTAKRGAAVRGIALDPDNAAHIEGRVKGQRIVLLTEFVKISG